MNTKSYIAIAVLLVILIGTYGYISSHPAGLDPTSTTGNQVQPPHKPQLDKKVLADNWNQLLTFASAPPLGDPNAKYTLVEVGDFQCPNCGTIRPVVEKLVTESHGQAKLYFVNFPLKMHPHARFAAEASIAAADQGKFWPMYEVLYQHQDELIPSEVQYYASTEIKGFDSNKFLADVNAAATKDRVAKQEAEVTSLKVDETPTLFVRKSSGGDVSWYIGIKDAPLSDTLGVSTLAAAPPWATGK